MKSSTAIHYIYIYNSPGISTYIQLYVIICGIYPSSRCLGTTTPPFFGVIPITMAFPSDPSLEHVTTFCCLAPELAKTHELIRDLAWFSHQKLDLTTKNCGKKQVFEVIFQLAMGIIGWISPWKEKENGNNILMYVSVKNCPFHTRVSWAPTLSVFPECSGWGQFVLVPRVWDWCTVSVQFQSSINQVCQVEISAISEGRPGLKIGYTPQCAHTSGDSD